MGSRRYLNVIIQRASVVRTLIPGQIIKTFRFVQIKINECKSKPEINILKSRNIIKMERREDI